MASQSGPAGAGWRLAETSLLTPRGEVASSPPAALFGCWRARRSVLLAKKQLERLCSTLRDLWVKTERMCGFWRRRRRRLRRRFTVRQQLVSHHPQSGRLLFHNHYLVPRWRQNVIRQPAVTVTPRKDRLLLSDSLNPRRRCQAALNATRAVSPSRSHRVPAAKKHRPHRPAGSNPNVITAFCGKKKTQRLKEKIPAIRFSSVWLCSEAQKPCFQGWTDTTGQHF